MDRGNHYEAAFEAYLRWHRLCYVGVDESRRAMLGDERVKSLDFIVYGERQARLLIDVKGRRYPSGSAERPRRVWECWSTQDDVDGLERWTKLFGPGYLGLLVFTYQLGSDLEIPEDTLDQWTFRGRRYLFRAIEVSAYRRHVRVRSPKWSTVCLPNAVFRDLVRPLDDFLRGLVPVVEECPF
jgi:hypothetical protein